MPAPTWQPSGDEKADAIVTRFKEARELDCTACELSDAGVKAVAFVLAHTNTVAAACLAGTNIGDERAQTLADGIKANRCALVPNGPTAVKHGELACPQLASSTALLAEHSGLHRRVRFLHQDFDAS